MHLIMNHLIHCCELEAISSHLMKKGAEADIYRTGTSVIKERAPKTYRIKELDLRLRKLRTRAEVKLLERAAGIINVPRIIKKNEFSIEMEFIKGPRVKDIISEKNYKRLCMKMAREIASLHKSEIIHGDLTTSNMLLQGEKIYFIDFGLGVFSKKPEDMAVDLHTLFEAFNSTHSKVAGKAISIIISEYEKAGGKKEVLARLERLKSRGRYIRRHKNGTF